MLWVIDKISNPKLINPNDFVWSIHHLFLIPPEGKVLLPVVTLGVYWGPIVLIVLMRWKSFCYGMDKLGPGLVIMVCVLMPLILVTEPRYITLAWPTVVLGMIVALDGMKLDLKFWRSYVLISIFFAQFWLKINIVPWSGPDTDGLLSFPKQLWFMHYGFWMSWPTFIAQSIALFLSLIWLSRSIKLNR